MQNTSGQIDRRAYLKTAGLATAGMAGLAGCTGGDSPDGDSGSGTDGDGETTYGTLSTSVTDQPSAIGDFESLTVTIDGVWIKPTGGTDAEMDDDSMAGGNESEEMAGGNESEEMDDGNESEAMSGGNESEEMDDDSMEDGETDGEGRRYIGFDEPQDANLVQLQGNNTQLVDETEVEAREYQFLQLDVSNTEGILTDGSEATVETPGNAPLKFNMSFEVRADERTRFIADFAPNRKGNGGYVIRPVATSTQVLYGDEEYTAGEESTGEMGGNETSGANSTGSQQGNGSASNNDN